MVNSPPAGRGRFSARLFGVAGLGLGWGLGGALLTAAELLPATLVSALVGAGLVVVGLTAAVLLARPRPRVAMLAAWIAALGAGVGAVALAAELSAGPLLPAALTAAGVIAVAWCALTLTALFAGAPLALRYAVVAALTLVCGGVLLWVYDVSSLVYVVSAAAGLCLAGYTLLRTEELARRFTVDEIAPASLALGAGVFEGMRDLALLIVGRDD